MKKIVVFALVLGGALFSQNSGVQRTVVYRADVSCPGREAVIARAEIAPGAETGWHRHPGEEISYIIEGEADILVDGQAPRHVKAGDGLVIPNGARHNARNTGKVPFKLSAVYLIEKGKPVATPAP